jgi:hypothetical protein
VFNEHAKSDWNGNKMFGFSRQDYLQQQESKLDRERRFAQYWDFKAHVAAGRSRRHWEEHVAAERSRLRDVSGGRSTERRRTRAAAAAGDGEGGAAGAEEEEQELPRALRQRRCQRRISLSAAAADDAGMAVEQALPAAPVEEALPMDVDAARDFIDLTVDSD